ncbi:hypothetical protein ABO04_02520 [Nitrosomonas sp. HPC101]|uniref:hypothetical protein n=1 Tax=Nitrosomonas sp. HPC101 TaxID=1658667 RepID=UPI00136FAE9B|nr:hypothetical protein [Nitrosomonas sp. HPC101]MXS84817.1 hypothetical protein [Nitrosomonas sp. HPC101]
MEDTSSPIATLIYSILAFPIAFMILYWIKVRKDRHRNESGEMEYKSLGHALSFFVVEGLALVGCLSVLITAVSGIIRYIIYVYG